MLHKLKGDTEQATNVENAAVKTGMEQSAEGLSLGHMCTSSKFM